MNKRKRLLISIGLVSCLIAGWAFFKPGIDNALAGLADNVSRWGWNGIYGWISFNQTDTGAGADYGVHMVMAPTAQQYNLTGYAWSENFGWLAFRRTGDCSLNSSIRCDETADCTAASAGTCNLQNPPIVYDRFRFNCLNSGACNGSNYCTSCVNAVGPAWPVYGWAKIVNLGPNGWVSLSSRICDADANGQSEGAAGCPAAGVAVPQYQVTVDASFNFHGWGWNGVDSNGDGLYESGVGWVSFNDDEIDTNDNDRLDVAFGGNDTTTVVPDYEVVGTNWNPQPAPPVTSITPDPVDRCIGLVVRWTDVAGERSYEVFRSTTNGFTPAAGNRIATLTYDVTSYLDTPLNPGTTYYYIVRAIDPFGQSDSVQAQGTTILQCAVAAPIALGICPDTARVDWDAVAAPGCTITEYVIARCKCTSAINCANCTATIYNIGTYATSTAPSACRPAVVGTNTICDDVFTTPPYLITDRHDYYKYIVRWLCSDGYYGRWSDPNNPSVLPCRRKPLWEEVK